MGFKLWNDTIVPHDDFLKPKTTALWWKRIIVNAFKVAVAMGFILWNDNIGLHDDFLKPKTTALWWKRIIMNAFKVAAVAMGFKLWNDNIVSHDDFLKPKTTALWWKRIIKNASKVGKGLSIDTDAHILVLKHWIEATDPRHRYGNNLQLYYKEWFKSSTNQHFFFWLDFGDGADLNLEVCPRSELNQQRVKYFGPQEREKYEYVVVDGKILNNMTRKPLHHGSPQLKYIFVVSTSKKLYIGEKEKGIFHHSSFLAGEATLTAGRLLVEHGVLKRISPSSGHYKPTEDSLERFLSILKEKGVNTEEVQIRKANEDFVSPNV